LEMVCGFVPEAIEVGQIVHYYQNNQDKLCRLILQEKIEQSAFGLSTEQLSNALDLVLTQYKEIKGEEKISSTTSVLLLPKLAKLLRQMTNEEDIDLGLKIANLVHQNGFAMSNLITIFLDLTALEENACEDRGNGLLPASRLMGLCTPILTQPNPTIPEMLELIEELRQNPMIVADIQDFSDYDKFMNKWEKWLARHPCILTYLDPHEVAIEPLVHNLPGVAAVVNALPALPGGQPWFLSDFQAPPPIANQWEGIYTLGSRSAARRCSTVLSTHFAVAPGG